MHSSIVIWQIKWIIYEAEDNYFDDHIIYIYIYISKQVTSLASSFFYYNKSLIMFLTFLVLISERISNLKVTWIVKLHGL